MVCLFEFIFGSDRGRVRFVSQVGLIDDGDEMITPIGRSGSIVAGVVQVTGTQ